MVAPALSETYKRRVKLAFVLLIVLLPAQFYVVYNYDNMYPCIHLPAFKPVLDDATALFYTDKELYAVTATKEKLPIKYTELFAELPEFFGRHTMQRLFAFDRPNEPIAVDNETLQWVDNRLQALTGRTDIAYLEVVTTGHRHKRDAPHEDDIIIQSTNRLQLP